jgi:hypothetical protein
VGELPSWPALFTPPAELLAWLDEQSRLHQRDPVQLRHWQALRWLVLAELDRKAPKGFRPGMPPTT